MGQVKQLKMELADANQRSSGSNSLVPPRLPDACPPVHEEKSGELVEHVNLTNKRRRKNDRKEPDRRKYSSLLVLRELETSQLREKNDQLLHERARQKIANCHDDCAAYDDLYY